MKRQTILMRTLSALVVVGMMLATTTTFAAARRAAVRVRVAAPVPAVRAAVVAPRVVVTPRAAVVVPRYVPRPVVRAGAAVAVYRGAQIAVASPTTVIAAPTTTVVAAPPELTTLPDEQTAPSTTYPVTDVDRDFTLTLTIDGRPTPVRLLGVQPLLVAETEGQPGELPQEAWDFVRNLLVGEKVYLGNDPQVAPNDAEGTRVAYVHRASDGLLVNLEIIRHGFGLADQDYAYTHRDAFVGYQNQAQSLGKGIWRGLTQASP